MLDERIINKLVERLVDRIEQGNTYVLEQIGKSIKKIGTLNPTNAYQLAQILKYGGNFDKITSKLAEITELNIKDIYKIFEEVAKKNSLFAKKFYDYKGIKYIPYEENIALQRKVRALATITANEYINTSKTLAFARKDIYGKTSYTLLSNMYQDVIDKAVVNISMGKTTFDKEMSKIIKELGQSGIRTVDYASGYSKRLDSAVRMNLKGALRDMSNTIQEQFGKEYGANGIEISVHLHPAPDHQDIQGKQFSKEKFELLNSELKRPIGQLNCYHYIFPIVLGVSEPEYTQEQLDKINSDNSKGFIYEDKHYTLYQGTQLQRKLETEIRKQKDIQIIGKASGNKEAVEKAQSEITKLTRKYKEISQISGLPTKLERARVQGYRRINVNKM